MNETAQDISLDASFDDMLDERQRSILEAMGIKLWLPDASLQIAAAPAQQAAAAQPKQQPAAQTILEENRPFPLIKSAQNAIESIAYSAPTPVRAAPTHVVTSAPIAAPVNLSPRAEGIEQMDWQALQRAVSACQACALCQSRKNTVFGIGQATADAALAPQVDWLIVGEAPGENEDAQGEPFVGPAGKLLDNMLAAMRVGVSDDGKAAGLSRQHGVYIANALKCRPPANRNPSPEEAAMCEPYLARQIELLRPKIIVAMGKFAIQSLTGSTEPVGKLRGRVHTLKHASYAAPVIVTYHPAYLLRNLPDKAKAWADLLLAMQTYRELKAT